MGAPLISVVMPVYNAERFLKEAIDSILNQTVTDFEFIILNDGSTDSSRNIINSHQDKRIKLLHSNENLGICARLNEGIKVASGKYIARMDSDDISLPERFQTQLAFLENNLEYGLCSTNACMIDEEGALIRNKMYLNDEAPMEWQLLWTNPIAHPTVMFRKELINQYNFKYDSEMYPAEDYDLWCKMSAVTRFYRFDNNLLKYRVSQGSAYHSNSQKAIDISTEICTNYLVSNLLNQEIPAFHKEISKLSFSGNGNLEKVALKDIISWTSYLTETFINKYKWTATESLLAKRNNYLRLISIIKRLRISYVKKFYLFLSEIPLNILVSTFLLRVGFKR